MAVEISATKYGIMTSTGANSGWVTAFTSTLWSLQASAKWTITKSSNSYLVLPVFYLKLVKTTTVDPSGSITIAAIQGGQKTGFNNFGVVETAFTWKSIKNISTDSTKLGDASSATLDVSSVYTDETKTGELKYSGGIKLTFDTGETVNLHFNFYGTFFGTKQRKYYTLRFYNDDDRELTELRKTNIEEGSTVYLPSAQTSTKTPKDTSVSQTYYVSYDTRGGTAVSPNPKSLSGSYIQHWKNVFSYWLLRSTSAHYAAYASYTVNSNGEFYAKYDTVKNGTDQGTTPSIGSLPTTYKKGYNKTSSWYDSGGAPVSSSTQISSSITIHVDWTGLNREYQISYNLNGGTMPADAGRIGDYKDSKTYDISGPTIPTFIPLRVGYKFIGWGDINGNYVQQPGKYINDNIYNSINNEQSNNSVVFYAQWVYNPNTVIFNYWYNTQDSDPNHDTHIYGKDTDHSETAQYNISASTFKYGAPVKGTRTGDYVFLGWSDIKPDEFDDPSKINEGYHGVYNIPPSEIVVGTLKSDIELPLEINILALKKLEDWGNDYTYYGLWAKTGKYIMVNNEFKKVSNMYVKDNDLWHTVTDVWTYLNGEWKKEV